MTWQVTRIVALTLAAALWNCAPTLTIGGNTANFGGQALSPGFSPDPLSVPVVSGGNIDASRLPNGCAGWITSQPDYIVHLTGPSHHLRFYALSSADTTLVINAADGSWQCNDDSYGGLNPTVSIAQAPAGQYDVWVGSYQSGVQAQAVLHVTELDYHP
jgi:hypothetical protein